MRSARHNEEQWERDYLMRYRAWELGQKEQEQGEWWTDYCLVLGFVIVLALAVVGLK